ncbi:density-regulated protein DRP1 [Sistotremastrum suecicum HHB10207 ss-3]|uniref:Translation machinery-associated protein 22 n=1 Tax=Sistotremastrum suecicum HHB10207 ss-3 TaxID=1314776 RepID=A0A165ZW24_9AGAM|nr:density-regulated protein DRP1 [Sistotremastrum suecicum HHB10207 ss-3]
MGKKKNVQPPPPSTSTLPDSIADGEGNVVGEGAVVEEVKKEGVKPLEVLYCQGELRYPIDVGCDDDLVIVCSFPPEFCEFGSSLTRCKAWLHEEHPDLFDKYYSEDALVEKTALLSTEAATKLEKDTAKKEAKAEAKARAEEERKKEAKVIVKRIERNKRKYVTSISGLEAFGIDLKKAAKLFAQKFATGASVTKTVTGGEEIVVQGDVSDEIVDMFEEANESSKESALKGVPEDNIEVVEEKKKKGGD